MKNQETDRRPISARDSQYSRKISSFFARRGISPNNISAFSMIFAAGAGYCLIATSRYFSHRIWWILAAAFILLRLLANMFDGMVAMETGEISSLGGTF